MKDISKDKLRKAIEAHEKWLEIDPDGKQLCLFRFNIIDVDLRGCNLRYCDLRSCNLSNSNLRDCDLRGSDLSNSDLRGCNLSNSNLSNSNLRDCDLRGSDLSNSDLRGCNLSNSDLRGSDLSNSNLRSCNLSNSDLRDCDLRGSDLSGCVGLKSQTDFMAENFERTADGYIAYKKFGWCFATPPQWRIEPGSVLEEVVNYDRTYPCGCGINVASLAWAEENIACDPAWKVLIRWEWLPGVCVPYNSDGKIRCEKVELIEEVKL